MEHGIGQVTRVVGSTNLGPREGAAAGERDPAPPRRAHPPGHPGDRPRGVTARGDGPRPRRAIRSRSGWPPPGIRPWSSAWRRDIGRDLRAGGAQQTLAPVIDISRDPRWGRFEETYGEDPYLVASMGVAYVRGVQGTGWRPGTGWGHRNGQAHGRSRHPGGRPQPRSGAPRVGASCATGSCCRSRQRSASVASARSCTPTTTSTGCPASPRESC